MGLVQAAQRGAELGAEHARQRRLLGGDHGDLDAARAQRGRRLERDEAGAHHDRAPRPWDLRDDRPAVGEGAQRVDVGLLGARDRQPDRLGARGQQQRLPLDRRPVAQRRDAPARVDRGDAGAHPQIDPVLGIELARAQRDPFLGGGPREIVLREVGAIVGWVGVGPDQHDGSLVALPAQHLRCGMAGRAGADDQDRRRGGGRGGDRRGALAGDANQISAANDVEAGQGIERRRSLRGAGAQVEAGVVPGTAHHAVADRPLGQRTTVMGAGRPDGEDLLAPPHHQHGVFAGVSDDRLPVHELGQRDPRRQIRSAWLSLVSAHGR